MTVEEWKEQLRRVAHPEKVADLMRFFKTGAGQYGEGDKFIGIYVPDNRKVSVGYACLPLEELKRMLDEDVHEFRLAGFLALVRKYSKAGSQIERDRIVDFYLENGHKANNWDLVDLSTEYILGEELANGRRLEAVDELLASDNLWRQRIAMVAMLTPVRHNMLDLPLATAEALLTHSHDLMRKAIGWVLREVGKKDKERLVVFLQSHIAEVASITLSYATEKFTKEERLYFRRLRKVAVGR